MEVMMSSNEVGFLQSQYNTTLLPGVRKIPCGHAPIGSQVTVTRPVESVQVLCLNLHKNRDVPGDGLWETNY